MVILLPSCRRQGSAARSFCVRKTQQSSVSSTWHSTGTANQFSEQEPVFWWVGRIPVKDGGHCSLLGAAAGWVSSGSGGPPCREGSRGPDCLPDAEGAENQSHQSHRSRRSGILKCVSFRGEVLLPPLLGRGCRCVAGPALSASLGSQPPGWYFCAAPGFRNCFHRPLLVAGCLVPHACCGLTCLFPSLTCPLPLPLCISVKLGSRPAAARGGPGPAPTSPPSSSQPSHSLPSPARFTAGSVKPLYLGLNAPLSCGWGNCWFFFFFNASSMLYKFSLFFYGAFVLLLFCCCFLH